MPRNDRKYTKLERLGFKYLPGLQSLYRNGIYWGRECYVPGFTLQPKLATPAKKLALRNIAKGIEDPELREKVTPTYAIGCKRILISNTYYPALDADNVDLVTDGIAKVTGDAIVTADGVERPIDVLIVATGFFTTELPITEHLVGRSGKSLADTWRETGMAGYKGTTVADFPNLFFIVGPNTGLGHSSMVYMIESQVTYIREAIRTMRRNDYAVVEVNAGRPARLQRRPPAPDEAHGVDDRWLRELVPRRPRQQHHPVAAHHVRVPRADQGVRRRGLLRSRHPRPRPSRRRSPHEDARRQGGRDHRCRLRHRPRPRPQPGQAWLAARHLRRRRGRPRRDRRPGEGRRCARGAQRPARRRRPRRDGRLRRRRRRAVRPGQRDHQQRRRRALR